MARKKSELVQALEAQAGPDLEAHQRYLDRVMADHTERAKQSLAEKGLARRAGETVEAWRKRTVEWLKQQSPGFKRFGENGIEQHD